MGACMGDYYGSSNGRFVEIDAGVKDYSISGGSLVNVYSPASKVFAKSRNFGETGFSHTHSSIS